MPWSTKFTRPKIFRRGITPAYSGSTSGRTAFSANTQDHPRVCREHRARPADEIGEVGSPPRMQGARHLSPADVCRKGINPEYAGNTSPHCSKVGGFRITPAYAGSTKVRLESRAPTMDHPRVCGEHSGSRHMVMVGVGSSPRMRGALSAMFSSYTLLGIIPAYAGSTDAASTCGAVSHGSSPRMRGAQI